MGLAKGASIGALALVLGAMLELGGCQTVENARARIERTASTCTDQTVQIYFDPGAAAVTPEGRAVIAAAARQARGCQVRDVEVIGLADAAGAPEANLELSRKRAESVTAVLAESGLPNAEFRVAAAGAAGAVTPDGKDAPLRRRVDVVLHLARR